MALSTGESVSAPAAGIEQHTWVKPRLSLDSGAVAVDMVLLTAGEWKPPAVKGKIELPAAAFFHAGMSDHEGRVALRPDRDPAGAVFYGLNLPLPPGRYRAEVQFSSEAPDGIVLGSLEAAGRSVAGTPAPVRAGNVARTEFKVGAELPVRLNLVYNRAADLRVGTVTLMRLE